MASDAAEGAREKGLGLIRMFFSGARGVGLLSWGVGGRAVLAAVAAVAAAALLVLVVAVRSAAADSFVWSQILSGQGSDNSIACPATSVCVVGGGLSNSWETAFNPFSPGTPVHHSLPGSGGIYAIACPSTSQCTGIDDNDFEVTFNPASPGSPTEVQIDNAPLIGSNSWGVQDISCPSQTQCTGVDSQSSEVTFNPQSPPATQNPQTIDTNTASNSNYEYFVSCPSVTQCTALDGINTEITFDPGASPWTGKPTIISTHAFANSFNIGGLACPSTTQCTDVYTFPGGGTASYEVTFNPTNPGNPSPVALNMYALSGGAVGSFVSCPSVTQCTVSGSDTNGNGVYEVTFNPQAPGTPALKPIPEGGAISCPSVNECVMVDGYGRVVLGTPSSGGGTGNAKCVVPKVKGKTLAAARTAIVKAHCTVGKIKKASSKQVKKGHVISQNPAAGGTLSSGSKINLVVSKGGNHK